jgi:hypothetical protein
MAAFLREHTVYEDERPRELRLFSLNLNPG